VQIVSLANLFNNLFEGEVKLTDTDLAFWDLTVEEAKAMAEAAEAEAKGVAESIGIEILARRDLPRFAPAQDDTAHASLAQAVSTRLEAQSTLPETWEGPEQEEVYLGILRSARMLFASRNATLFVARGDALQGRHTGDDDSRLGEILIHLPARDSAIARAFSGQAGLAGEHPARENLADAQVLRILGCERLLCLPLSHAGKALGVLVIGMDANAAQTFMQRRALITTFAREGGRRLAQSLQRLDLESSIRDEAHQQFQLHARKVVHEANNPLGVIRNYIGLLREELSDKKQAQEDFDLVESELRRVARILQQFKDVDGTAPTGTGESAGVDINVLINDVIRFCRLGRSELQNVDTKLQLDSSLPPIRVNGDKVKQVLTNLIFNAAEAMPQGGEISISSANWQTAKGRNSVEIIVRDNGPGLPPAVLERLYQPVQSRKGGAHQGLGLSIVGKLVEELGGMLQCNTSQSGTSFKIMLPSSK
jgi:nitrogen-specific signal transduction histidine kinase